ncbi:hypothetical protein HH303_15445 [Rhodospirillaceae bacterium KN72]|uniref:Uncharacterized protein n=1 Tax=Pacificispira spongiicola TaxID=2729598 RepID=A0A7Y0HFH4_9PROT|nr:hypothetical protein [Pacificispira spongiicola]NMM45891.1 hypothetical protein [Pacificispira spongiicola]
MKRSVRTGLAGIALAGLATITLAGTPSLRAEGEGVFSSPVDPKACGERLNTMISGDFAPFWSFVDRHGYSGVTDYVSSVPELPGESSEDWGKRSLQCVLEVERSNKRSDTVETRLALGYLLWFGTANRGCECGDAEDGGPDARERGYTMMRSAADDGYDPAIEALIQVYMEMATTEDRLHAYAGRLGKEPEDIPDWWPKSDRLLLALDRMAKTGHASAYLAISAIYSERALLVGATGHDHLGNPAKSPDPRLIEASKAYRKVWEEKRAESEVRN